MFQTKALKGLCVVLLCLFNGLSASGQITVNGLTDRTDYNDTVTFTIATQPGFTYSALLNTNPVPAGVPITVNEPDYYELRVARVENGTGATANLLVRFIVVASERGDTEVGLPRQFAWPMITSSPDELSDAHLRLLMPGRFPIGYEIPVVAWVEDAAGHAVRANGFVTSPGHPSIQIRRGVGSGFLASTNPAGTLNYPAAIQGLMTNKSVTLEANTTWTTVSGTLSGNISWPDNSRIHISTNVTVNAGATLTIGPGTIVRLNPWTDMTNNGAVVINGTREQPVVFMPNTRSQPWGGFIMRNGTGSITGTGVIFTGSGAEANWFGVGGNPGSHRDEQALFYVHNSQTVSLTDSAAIYLAGQLGHSVNGGNFAFDHFLLQRATSGGEFTGSTWHVNDSAFIEFPDDTVNFVNGDNDALYFVSGFQGFTNSLVGWTKDDGIDCGGSGYGTLVFQSCWFEATAHEANALSGFKNVFANDSVYIGCGQGFEVGYQSPTGHVTRCLITDNLVGVRHGDNYDGGNGNYAGRLTAANSIILHNHHDIFGYNWHSSGGWTQALGQISATANFLTRVDTNYPNNSVWQPTIDGWRLGAFGARGRVGVGLAIRPNQTTLADFPDGIPVGLSIFCTNEVRVDYSILGTDGTSRSGTLIFPPGKTRDHISLPGGFSGVLRVALENPVNADLTGTPQLLFQNFTGKILSPLGATWKYLDNGSDQGTAWRAPAFDDSNWSNGIARLGFGGDAAATTTIRRYLSGNSGPQITNYYFRRAIVITNDPADLGTIQFRYQRDDGCIVYLNGTPLFTNNMPAGPVNFMTFAATTISSAADTQRFWTNTFPATILRPGTNVIAVEVHQSTATSSDVAWEMELQAVSSGPSRLNITRLGTDAVLHWTDSAFTLQEADAITGPWRPAASTNSPSPAPVSGTRFYRLRR